MRFLWAKSTWLWGAGIAALVPYFFAWRLQDLRQQTVAFEYTFFAAFLLYGIVTVIALRQTTWTWRTLGLSFLLAGAMQAFLIFTPPTLSDDMYRYVWDGRVQAHGFSPWRYPPEAAELAPLRDEVIWPWINRKWAVPVYPPAAELSFALLWRLWPDNVRWFQFAMAFSGLVAGGLLVGLLRSLQLSTARVVIYLWSPLLAFETAQAAHVDAVALPFLVGAWWARVRERDGLVGILLGIATAVKLYPIFLLPALWRPQPARGRWLMPVAFGLTLLTCYAPYVLRFGLQLGFLPNYFRERFNMGLAGLLLPLFQRWGLDPDRTLLLLNLALLAGLGLWMVWHPVSNGAGALRRSLWLIGTFTLLTQNLFSWYLLWLLPLIAIFLQPGAMLGLRVDGWSGWWLFCGLIGLSYTFFIIWRPVPWAIWAQFVPLYGLLLAGVVRWLLHQWANRERFRSLQLPKNKQDVR